MSYKTSQEEFWSKDFGDKYPSRNNDVELISSRLYWFSQILSHTKDISSTIDFGSNIGLNPRALRQLLPNASHSAIEINESAVKELRNIPDLDVHHQSILEFKPEMKYDFVLIKGVLIHINPDHLMDVYQTLYDSSAKYICVMEYYDPNPVSLDYRGEKDKLFKRDFAGEMMDKFSDLELLGYGFAYHRDLNYPLDDGTWFLMKKNS